MYIAQACENCYRVDVQNMEKSFVIKLSKGTIIKTLF